MFKLAIDPGHGRSNRKPGVYDPGAVSNGLEEADIALQFALTIKWVFSRAGIAVYLTRDDDQDDVPVGRRDDMAEMARCSHFISLHCNASVSHRGTGTETYYRGAEDKPFAATINAFAVNALGLENRGVKPEAQSQHPHLAVLDFDGKACLLELGFIDNEFDRRSLTRRECRLIFANQLLDFWKRTAGLK